ncbi:hypothetical protein DPMN_153206 [Dreissena polymorpha]|uniref:Uncharacterized protein n=1 Tax=Dreissena polymorpha TaxID=45954 RepID=A0A9D4J5V6_DREPO|nr:hypothetical protein DPMN_152994 [Dreissena polymorpha]KAH3799595.1 hypothetical protein DPMN_153206 [Dreissena polymorpha]
MLKYFINILKVIFASSQLWGIRFPRATISTLFGPIPVRNLLLSPALGNSPFDGLLYAAADPLSSPFSNSFGMPLMSRAKRTKFGILISSSSSVFSQFVNASPVAIVRPFPAGAFATEMQASNNADSHQVTINIISSSQLVIIATVIISVG